MAVDLQGHVFSGSFAVTGEYTTQFRASSSTAAPGQNNAYYVYIPIAESCTLDRIGIEVTAGAASSTVRLGLYAAGADGKPGTLLVDAGTVDTSTTGVKEATISQAVTAPGVWACAVRQTANGATLRISQDGNDHHPRYTRSTASVVTQYSLNCWAQTGVSGALGTPGTLIGDIGCPLIVLRFA